MPELTEHLADYHLRKNYALWSWLVNYKEQKVYGFVFYMCASVMCVCAPFNVRNS